MPPVLAGRETCPAVEGVREVREVLIAQLDCYICDPESGLGEQLLRCAKALLFYDTGVADAALGKPTL